MRERDAYYDAYIRRERDMRVVAMRARALLLLRVWL